MTKQFFVNFDILKTIDLGQHVKLNIEKIINDYSEKVFIDNKVIETKKVIVNFISNNITIDFDKIGMQTISEDLDTNEAECILAILYYLNKEFATAIKINAFVDTKKKPALENYDAEVINAAKYLKETFDINFVPIKIINKEAAFKNLSRYLLIYEDLFNNLISQDWSGYDVDFSDIPLDITQIEILLRKNAFLIPLIIDEENRNLFSLCAKDVEACEKIQKAYNSTVAFCEESSKVKAGEDSLLGPEDIKAMLTVKKQIIIKNIITHFKTAYNCEVNEDKIVEKYIDREFHYKDIVIEILSSYNWVQLDETTKISQKNFIKNFIASGYNGIQIKRKRVIFNEITKIRKFTDTSLVRVDTDVNDLYGFVKALSVYDSGEYLEKLIVPVDASPFQTFYKQIAMVKEKRAFIKPFRSPAMKKIKELSINMDGDFTIEFFSDIERDNFINEFTK